MGRGKQRPYAQTRRLVVGAGLAPLARLAQAPIRAPRGVAPLKRQRYAVLVLDIVVSSTPSRAWPH